MSNGNQDRSRNVSNGNQDSTGISDSWVDLSGQLGTTTPPLLYGTRTPPFPTSAVSPRRVTPVPFGGEHDYLRMLREAQKESNRSSTKVSPISSALMSLSTTPKRNTPSSSPKSPPNSPNSELATFTEELRGVYINRMKTDHVAVHGYSNNGSNGGNGPSSTVSNNGTHGVTASDIVWDWTSRPNIPPKEWKLPTSSSRSRKSSESSKFSIQNGKVIKKSLFSKEVMYTLVITNLLSFLIGTGIGIWLSKRVVDQCGCCGEMIDIAL